MIFTAFFTDNGAPKTGLSPTITIYNVSSSATFVSGAMSEVGDGHYKYTLTNYTGSVAYGAIADAGATLSGNERYYSFANENYLNDIFSANISLYSTGSFGKSLDNTYNIMGGKWKIEGKQLIVYKDDNSTEVMRFDLFDVNNEAINSSTGIFQRTKN
tara:strand:- start:2122 stop:2595 length:474 start_codon:yes stop_codon:yes gene_type:complete